MSGVSSRQFTIPFIKKVREARNAWTFYFDRSSLGSSYDFFPGQYNNVTLPVTDKNGNNRDFTISSSPSEKDFLTITTKIENHPSVFKKAFFSLKAGEKVSFIGPLGGFFLRKEDKTPRVFLAGGIGITPFRSMIKYISDNNLDIPITLIVSFSTAKDVILYEELHQISNRHKNIKTIFTISHLEDTQTKWQGEIGRISEVLIKKYVHGIKSPIFEVSGSPTMVDSLVELLQNIKIPEERIKAEHFTGY